MPRPSARYIQELAAKWEPRLRDAFLSAIDDVRTRINISDLARLLENGDVEGALRVVGLNPADFSQLSLDLAAAFNEGGMTAAQTIPRVIVRFNVRNLVAERILAEQAGTLIQGLTDDQLQVVRIFLQRGLAAGRNPRDTALDLVGRLDRVRGVRVGGVIGLSTQQEEWLASYSRYLQSADPADLRKLLGYGLRDKRFDRSVFKAILEGRALDPDIAEKMRLQYANQALKWRGDNIARTETIRALGKAQTEAYRQAIVDGKIDVNTITRYWVTTGDARVRPAHRLIPGMNKGGRRWNEPFATPTGPTMHAPHDTDPMCRCHERIKIDFLAAAVRQLRGAA